MAATNSAAVMVLSCSKAAKDWQTSSEQDCFSIEERQQAERIWNINARALFINGRWLLRHCLAPRIGCTPGNIRFSFGRHGKPKLCAVAHPHSILAFNVAHCCDHVVIAIASKGHIGIDIERRDRHLAWQSISRKFFADSEYQAMLQLPEHLQRTAFMRTWVRKEALLKALGSGIAGGLKSFQLHISASSLAQVEAININGQQHRWSLTDVDLSDTHFVSLAADRPLGQINIQATPGKMFDQYNGTAAEVLRGAQSMSQFPGG